MAKKKKYYVVWQGAKPGIYDSWESCQRQINGFPAAKYKAFESQQEAEAAFKNSYAAHYNKPAPKAAGKKISPRSTIVWDSISVDAACSGNPGVMEYQGVDTKTKHQFFHQKFSLGTNNIGEFLAIVHALAMFHRAGKQTAIYTDSRNAMAWVKNKKCKTTLERNDRTEQLYQIIERAEDWLKTHTWQNPILKWETESWGEIPADFGRK
ncbi:MAG: viroplasmin family protein [Lewinellaceae bacterium]|nr:ribonuclease H family protein [Saprospiraceae bacterium]MCB9341402.1 viroplasmin family protein [Lewinellaceae bacterium]